ncbi:phosphatidate cytidylyltransferase [Denitrobaculum tricleocarpae]|nr:phosphatidate cytidylyltransferase [Denitrobaculum tricleocarpae]
MRSGSINGVIGVLVQQLTLDNMSPLMQRVLTAVVLAPPVLLALYFGTPYSDLLILLAAGVAAWEWSRLCNRGTLDVTAGLVIGAVLAAVLAAELGLYSVSAWVVVVGAMATAVLASNRQHESVAWMVGGVIYLSWTFISFVWLSQPEIFGYQGIFWLLFVVWATDIGAYAAGRSIGGPKLAPRFSPNKTWSGLIGGALAAVAISLAVGAWVFSGGDPAYLGPPWGYLVMAGVVLAVVAQMGDLFESRLKRQFDAKDSSRIIPGHGGVLDRIDGLLAASLACAAAVWLGQRMGL